MRPSRQISKSRRTFLKKAAAATAGPLGFPDHPWRGFGADGTYAAEQPDLAGADRRGHGGPGPPARFLQRTGSAGGRRLRRRPVAAGERPGHDGQAYADRRTSGIYRGCAAYNDLRELLARDDIDAVFIATGDRWHALATVWPPRRARTSTSRSPSR